MSQHGISRRGGALFLDEEQDGMLHRAFLRGEGFSEQEVRRQPVVGIASTASELNPCNQGLGSLARHVKAGIRAAGGLPLEFPTISISEPFTRPTSLFLRNLLSMDVEEMVRSAPIDGVVLLGGCDKTIPAQLMGAISAGKPALVLAAGPRPVSRFREQEAFTIDDVWPICEAHRLGNVDDAQWRELEGAVNVGVGTCNVMGTATTMAIIAEVLGFALPGSSLASAASKARVEIAHQTGARIIDHIFNARIPQNQVTMASLENAFRVIAALGGSTNAVIHLEAIAGRAGLRIGVERFRRWAEDTPQLGDVRPTGAHLLSDLERAGGTIEVMRQLGARIHTGTSTAGEDTWEEVINQATPSLAAAIRGIENPIMPRAGLRMLRGNLAPDGCIIKVVPDMPVQYRGPAVVFDGLEDLHKRIDDPTLEVEANSILVLRGMGVLGAPGMPEVGHLPIPAKLRRRGVRDMLRISDARMSGTSTGAVVLHVCPEAAAGGPLAYLRTGDIVRVDAERGLIEHEVPEHEFVARTPVRCPAIAKRGYAWLFQQHVTQPDQGCDFDFLQAEEVHM